MILPREKKTLADLLDRIHDLYRSIAFEADIATQDMHGITWEDETRVKVLDSIERTVKRIRELQHLIDIGYYKEVNNYGRV